MLADVFVTGRRTMYRGIEMRSRLEARVASLLDELGLDWQYEPRAYRVGNEEYLPDFQIGERTFLEVKPRLTPPGTRIVTDAQELAVDRAVRVIFDAVDDPLFWFVLSDGHAIVWGWDQPVLVGLVGLCGGGHLSLVNPPRMSCITCGEPWTLLGQRLGQVA